MPCEFDKKSFQDSYRVAADTLKQEQPGLSDHEVRRTVAQQFRPIFQEMVKSNTVEKQGEETYENGDFTITPDGKMYFPSTGQTAEQLHENDLRKSRLNLGSYSRTDHETTLLIQQAFAEGATVVRTSFAREGRDNRDILEYRLDPKTNRGKIIVTNAALDGNFHDFDTIHAIVKKQSPHLVETTLSHHTFVLANVSVRQEHVQAIRESTTRLEKPMQIFSPGAHLFSTNEKFGQIEQMHPKEVGIAHAKPVMGEVPPARKQAIERTRDEGRHPQNIVSNVVTETAATAHSTKNFITAKERRHRVEYRSRVRPIVEQITQLFQNEKADPPQKHKKVDRVFLQTKKQEVVSAVKHVEHVAKKQERELGLLRFIIATKTVEGAIPVILTSLSSEIFRPKSAGEKSVIRHEKKKTRKQKNEARKQKRSEHRAKNVLHQAQNMVFAENMSIAGKKLVEKPKRRKKRLFQMVDRILGPKGIDILALPDKPKEKMQLQKAPEQRKVSRKEKRKMKRLEKRAVRILEQKGIVGKEKQLWLVLVRIISRKNVTEKQVRYLTEQKNKESVKESGKKKESATPETKTGKQLKHTVSPEEASLNFSLGLVVLLLLSMKEQLHSEQAGMMIEQAGATEAKDIEHPWVLLSIIWQMSMIREGGQSVVSNQSSAIRQKKTQSIAPRGIIFMYGS